MIQESQQFDARTHALRYREYNTIQGRLQNVTQHLPPMYAYMYVCIHVCTYVCMYVCMYVYYMYVYMYVRMYGYVLWMDGFQNLATLSNTAREARLVGNAGQLRLSFNHTQIAKVM